MRSSMHYMRFGKALELLVNIFKPLRHHYTPHFARTYHPELTAARASDRAASMCKSAVRLSYVRAGFASTVH